MTAGSGHFYNSSDGDVLDAIVLGHYGDILDNKVEAVLAANPGLSRQGAVLGPGVRVFLPDLVTTTPVETEMLWG